ncbi:WcaF family extracellular polysaccharide biosynthesis acetyltransferase [Thermoanaerobacterium thermosaccharolyticum]|uniref:Acetyltransferase (Isoleucine patch superfamily) n=1 Tax=Thermoanaerobacterium thermosaccharolyticum M0795 TaxID=698948 RepID=L0IKM7_THETR|nr:WcaF family extracellular polysaccharide biosynthesis acetyltransferase [Thermoanaerobacterium thermosaccharolyticum]AGB18537.1 acetyltransferase (isoleucine patch superfamily) [Thermoanaerobacterium thermosaccharolyticum M0795]
MQSKIDLSKYDQSWYSRGRPNWYILFWWFIQGTIFRYSIHNMYGFRRFILRLFGAKVGRNVLIRPDAKFYYPWNVEIGDNSWIGDNVYFYSLDKIIVGSNCVVSQNTYLNTGAHDIADPHFGLITKPIVIKDGAWICANTFINLGVTIGYNTVIGAMSNVTKDMPDNMVCVGNPCKPLKLREIRDK